jgi:hypothetical protein
MLEALVVDQTAAMNFIEGTHRHHGRLPGWKWGHGVASNGQLVGVAVCGRPTSQELAKREPHTIEVRRVATDGTRNACSFLYARARDAAVSKGYNRVITYILEHEPGTSLKAAGFRFVRMTDGGSWDRPSRPRKDKAPTGPKQLWEWRKS